MTCALVAAGWVALYPSMTTCAEQARKIEGVECRPIVRIK